MRVTRGLTPLERSLWKTDLGAPLNFTTVARVTGALKSEALMKALRALRARHPHLREKIVDGNFREGDVPDLSLRESSGDWVAELDREINEPIRIPLARFVRVNEHLLISLHHSIGDGMSGVYLMRDWLTAATGGVLAPLTDPGGVDALLPASPGFLNHARFIANDTWVKVTCGSLLRLKREQQKYAHERRARVIPIELDAAFVETLTARARGEKTTVHGALSAAMLLGLLADSGKSRAGVMFGSPVNVRAQLQPPPGEALGFYVSMSSYRAGLSSSHGFWDTARKVRRALERDAARKGAISILQLLPTVFGMLGLEKLEPKKLVERWERWLPTTSGLTNLGRLAVPTQYGPLTLESCHFAACPSALGDFLGTATSLHGQLFWNFVWPDPVVSEHHARALVTCIVDRLKAAVAS